MIYESEMSSMFDNRFDIRQESHFKLHLAPRPCVEHDPGFVSPPTLSRLFPILTSSLLLSTIDGWFVDFIGNVLSS
jgi:hypothetical protein